MNQLIAVVGGHRSGAGTIAEASGHGQRDGHGDGCTDTDLAFDLEFTAMQSNEAFDHGEADATALKAQTSKLTNTF